MDLIKDYFLEANPNPERVGCPDEATIQALAEDRLPVRHPGRLHMAVCSECFCEYRGIRLKWLGARSSRHRVLRWAIAASLTLLTVGGGVWELQHLRAVRLSATMASVTPIETQIDLFNAGTFRGAANATHELQPAILPTAVVHLHLTLPRFSDPGSYRVMVLKEKSADRVIAKADGVARDVGGQAILDVSLDLRAANSGAYVLATASDKGSGYYYYPLNLRSR